MAEGTVTGAEARAEQLEFKRLGYRLVLAISPDGLDYHCSYEPFPAGAPLTNEELRSILLQADVVEGIDEGAIAALLSAATSGTQLADLLLAHGTPMVPGENGRFVPAVADSLRTAAPEDDDNLSTVDLRAVQEFLNVMPGQLVGTVLPPGDGTPGRTVDGKVIPAQPGLPLVPVPGKNVCLGDGGSALFAEAEGCVFIHGAEVSVEELLTVKGDVDFKVGNIIFNGFVEIKGDVLDDFSVKATKGIRVQGNIGECQIESAGGISFCGMNGQGKGGIRCGGEIVANFINDVTIECAGDVLVETEIRNCRIRTLGSIMVNKGTLAGGEYFALGGIEAGTIGTVTSLYTYIAAGVNYHDLERLNTLFGELKELINRFNADKTSPDRKLYMQARNAITEQIQQVRSMRYPTRNPKVNVKKMLYDRVNITLGTISEEIKEERKGPLSIIENTLEGGFRYLSRTDLSVRAEDIDRAFVQQHELLARKNKEVIQ